MTTRSTSNETARHGSALSARRALSGLLLAFAAVSILYAVVDEVRSFTTRPSQAPDQAVDTAAGLAQGTDPLIVAYFFHGYKRCRTCRTIEEHAHSALVEAYPDALQSGRLEWRAVNYEERANRHFAERFGLTASTVVLTKQSEGRIEEWRRLDRVWQLVDDEWNFKAYVEAEAMPYLEWDD